MTSVPDLGQRLADPGATPWPDADNDSAGRQAAARLRREHPGWIVLWLPAMHVYRAYPLFRAPAGMSLTATTPDDLARQISQVPQPASRPRRKPPGAGP